MDEGRASALALEMDIMVLGCLLGWSMGLSGER